jgi:hypothetical protein
MFKALLVFAVVFLVATFPSTWLLMLFLGNLGLGLSYWGTLPLGILVSASLGVSRFGSRRRTDFQRLRSSSRRRARSPSPDGRVELSVSADAWCST